MATVSRRSIEEKVGGDEIAREQWYLISDSTVDFLDQDDNTRHWWGTETMMKEFSSQLGVSLCVDAIGGTGYTRS